MKHNELGRHGEKLARQFLEEQGYLVLVENYRSNRLELDLVCEYDNKLIVVEVKTRNSNALGEPWQAVTRAKQRQIIRAANFYIQEFDIHLETRFDVISIIHNTKETLIEHLINAFTT